MKSISEILMDAANLERMNKENLTQEQKLILQAMIDKDRDLLEEIINGRKK